MSTETLATYFSERKQRGRAGLPVYSVTLDAGLVPRDTLDRRMESALGDDAHALVEPGDLAYNMMRMWQGALGVADRPCLVSPAYVVMCPKPSVDVKFAAAWMKSERGLNRLWAYSHGLTDDRLRLYPDDFLAIPVAFPPLAEQRRIATILDTWDDAIAVADRWADAQQLRPVWMQNAVLSGKLRLPRFSKPWKKVSLSQLLHEHGTTSSGVEPVFSVSVHRGLVDQIEHLGRSFAATSTAHYNLVRPGDVVYTKSPTGEFPLGIVKQSKVDRDVIVSPLYGVFTPVSGELGLFLDAYFASSQAALRYLTPLVQKGAKNTISVTNTQFLQGHIMVPTEEAEVVAVASFIQSMQSDIARGKLKTALLRRQKRGLMQKLLTGEWRVPATSDAFAPGGPVADRLETVE